MEMAGFILGANTIGLFLGGKMAQDWRNRWVVVPGIGGRF